MTRATQVMVPADEYNFGPTTNPRTRILCLFDSDKQDQVKGQQT